MVKTSYASNEFADLDDDSLHLLRIFVACEGRIRDMESSLGVSYPTVKSRLADLRKTLGFTDGGDAGTGSGPTTYAPGAPAAASAKEAATPATATPGTASVADTLAALEAGEIDFDEAMQRIRGNPGVS